MTIALIIFAVATFALLVWVLWKMTELDERQEELDKYSVHLDERANRLAADEESLRILFASFKREVETFDNSDIYTASYTVTDSDTRKYTTDALMVAHAKKHIATAIAQDIVKQFKVVESQTEDGRRKFTYRFKIVEQ
jgi:predicted nuclease with TOPRIM domain